MYLRSIALQGFKSFPDKTVLDFERGLTAVVGPNGSGKSNISDAVRWVLGEQSAKTLRSGKMEDVIFGGTNSKTAHGFCRVTLTLDNADRALNNDADLVEVTREYYRSGESNYKINGKNVRLKDVNELFMDTGLGRDGYSMVGQGKIEELVGAKSSDRRDMLEEASGISHYRYRRAETLRRLESAEDNLVRLRDIMGELESRVGPLKRQAEKAEKYLALADSRRTLEIGLWLLDAAREERRLKDARNKLTVAEAQYADTASKLENVVKLTEEADEAVRAETVRIENLQRESGELDSLAAEKESESAVLRANAENEKALAQQIENTISRDSDAADELSLRIKTNAEEKAAVEKKIEDANARRDKAAQELAGARKQSGELSGDIKELADELASLTVRISESTVGAKSAQSSADELGSQLVTSRADRDALAEKAKELAAVSEKAKKQLGECRDKRTGAANVLEGLRMKQSLRLAALEKANARYNELSVRLADEKNRLSFLVETEKNMDGYYGSVRAVVKAASQGRLTGIRGTVSKLIKTDPKYAVAIETALGAAVQNIVTETDADAKRAIRFLKDNDLGRCTFLPLNSVTDRGAHAPDLRREEGVFGRASELVDYDSEYAVIISSLLSRTVVADDLDTASALAKRHGYKFRIVTLDGQVINAGGSFTGGSRGNNTAFLTRSGSIEEMKKRVEARQAELREADDRRRSAEAEANSLRTQISAAEAENDEAAKLFYDANLAAESAAADVKNNADRLSVLNAAVSMLEARIKAFSGRSAEANAEIASLEEQSGRIKEELDQKSGRSADALDLEKAAQDRLNEINLELVGLVKEKESLEQAASELRDRLAAGSEQAGRLSEEREQHLLAARDMEARADGIKNEALGLRRGAEERRSSIADCVSARQSREQRSSELRAEERELSDLREKLAAERVRLEAERENAEAGVTEADNRLYAEYSLTRREAAELGITIEDPPEARKELASVRSRIRALGTVNPSAAEEYKEVSERYEFMKKQLDDVEKSKKELTDLTKELTEEMAARFKKSFDEINGHFSDAFTRLFGGGTAKLYLEDENDLLESDISVRAQPPGKNVRSMNLLSGGEKGLCAIALIFAILKANPAPFCIFDEVEAALDDVNVRRYAEYVRSMADNTQFILITHRRGTMEEADTLYGVTMQDEGISKLVKLEDTAWDGSAKEK
ncbi:MAG: chromosome segregation protein SMC [Clostridia bacterium]|nr:chromosome segregation protein SMC [Clostridia bacterium]